MLDTSIIIINWNTRDHLIHCVESFCADGIGEGNIVVVDQGSHDMSVETLQSRFPLVKVILLPENAGYGHAINAAVRTLETDCFFVANADVIVHKGTTARLREFMTADNRVALAGLRVVDPNGKEVTRFSRLTVLRAVLLEILPLWTRGLWRDFLVRRNRNLAPFDVSYVEGAFMMVRRSAFETVGGFDEGFTFFFEDADLPVRMIKAGFRIVHVPEASVTHIGAASFSQIPLKHAAEFNRNLIRFYERHSIRRAVWLRRFLLTVIFFKLAGLSILAYCFRANKQLSARKELNRTKWNSLLLGRKEGRRSENKNPFVSVIIPTYNREESLLTLLRGLKSQTYPNFETIVVDQSESIPAAKLEFLDSVGLTLRHVRTRSKGRPAARNVGIFHAKGDLLLFCDDDLEPPADLIEVHVEFLLADGIGAVSCRHSEPGLPSITSKDILKITFYGRVKAGFQSDTNCFVESLAGPNMSVRRNVQQGAGFFEPMLTGTAILEEPEWSGRIRHLGYKILFTNRTSAFHVPRENGNLDVRKKNPAEYYRDFHHNELVYFLKNRNHFLLIFVIPFCFLRSVKQSFNYGLGVAGAWRSFSGVFAGIDAYYRSLR